jgi:hypothetical protein
MPLVSNVTRTAISVQWGAPNNNGALLTAYKAWACELLMNGSSIAGGCAFVDADALSLSATIASLTPGRNYSVSVEAFNVVGSSGTATAPQTHNTLHAPMRGWPPARVPSLDGIDIMRTLHVMWAPPHNNGLPISKYELEVDGMPVGVPAQAMVQQHVVTGLEPGTSHELRGAHLVAGSNTGHVALSREPPLVVCSEFISDVRL